MVAITEQERMEFEARALLSFIEKSEFKPVKLSGRGGGYKVAYKHYLEVIETANNQKTAFVEVMKILLNGHNSLQTILNDLNSLRREAEV